VRVLDVEDEADVGEALRPVAVADGVQDQDLGGRQAGPACGGHAALHPAREAGPGQDQAELDLRQGRGCTGGQMRRGDDGRMIRHRADPPVRSSPPPYKLPGTLTICR
jgi:hypothetical protein